MSAHIQRTFGALLVGGLLAATFSGITTVQAGVYSKLFPKDRFFLKLLVVLIWGLDTIHTYFVGATLWDYLIAHYGNAARIDYISTNLALTIAFTATLTLLVHFFFIYRIHKLSMNNWAISLPLITLACARVGFAFLTTAKMIHLRSFEMFVELYTWSFTTGLSISTLVDILITLCLCYLLFRSQKQTTRLNHVLDKLMLYAFEVGALTTVATVTTLICWLTMHRNLIFMGVHFIICKFYANSLLATLNQRKGLVPADPEVTGLSNLPMFAKGAFNSFRRKCETSIWTKGSKLRIDVERTTHTDVFPPETDEGDTPSTSPTSPKPALVVA